MIVACCNNPSCRSDLVDLNDGQGLLCIRCGNEFSQEEACLKYISMSDIHARLAAIYTKTTIRRN